MGISKVYRGYVIEDINGQYYIHNAPNYTNGVAFSPGPHGGWTVATHQVDKLIDYMNRESDRDRGRYQHQDYEPMRYSSPSYSYDNDDENDTVESPPKEWEEMDLLEKIIYLVVCSFLWGVVIVFGLFVLNAIFN